jgi:hypothetical protein
LRNGHGSIFTQVQPESGIKKALLCRAWPDASIDQAAFFLVLVFFFLATFLAALGASAADLAGAAAGAVTGAFAGEAAGAAGTTGAVGAGVCARVAKLMTLKALAMMNLYMELLSKTKQEENTANWRRAV